MDGLCSEVLQLILYELDEGHVLHFNQTCKTFNRLCTDPYVRAQYFIARYGHDQAMYFALGRGRLITERVLDLLISSGARLSRYLVQLATHTYFHTTHHPFIRLPWVRSLPLTVFAHFLTMASNKYGDIPRNKGEDDGTLFSIFIKESRIPAIHKSVKWEEIRDIFEKFNFIPFCNKDPLMTQLPLTLAIEPRLLPYARANGFKMDSKYRDFVFRKMFEKPLSPESERSSEIVTNVRELCRLDPCMFVSRTVASEVCMEAISNEHAYAALKLLDKGGLLLFDLTTLVADLLKMFARSRCISTRDIIATARKLYHDFPSRDPQVRHTLILTLFFDSQGNHEQYASEIQRNLESLQLSPVTISDIKLVLLSPFIQNHQGVMVYARTQVGEREDGSKGLTKPEQKDLLAEVAVRCLEIASKGKFLKSLCEHYPFLYDCIAQAVLYMYSLHPEDFSMTTEEGNVKVKGPKMSGRLSRCHFDTPPSIFLDDHVGQGMAANGQQPLETSLLADKMDVDSVPKEEGPALKARNRNLGYITLETLSSMIRQDEMLPSRARRRWYYGLTSRDSASNLPYPNDPLPVAKFIYEHYGAESPVTAVFLTHGILNHNYSVLNSYFPLASTDLMGHARPHVPITLKHFKIMARIGRAPDYHVWNQIHRGAKFYRSEEDYVDKSDRSVALHHSLLEGERNGEYQLPPVKEDNLLHRSATSEVPPPLTGKRPRRSAAAKISYVDPDSDDESILPDDEMPKYVEPKPRKPSGTLRTPKSDFQLWIHHLTEIEEEEKAKHRTKRKELIKMARPGDKPVVYRTEFFKSLTSNLREFRAIDEIRRAEQPSTADNTDNISDLDDGDSEYTLSRPTKRRKVA